MGDWFDIVLISWRWIFWCMAIALRGYANIGYYLAGERMKSVKFMGNMMLASVFLVGASLAGFSSLVRRLVNCSK